MLTLLLMCGAAPEGLTPEKAAAAITVPDGFTATLFAGEPDVHQPVAFCFDDRGRLWVAEAYCYPQRMPFPGPLLPEKERSKGDKILIFEDVDGDGKFDKRTVFIEGLNLVSGIEYGFGGIYVGAAPYLMHIPIKDDKPAGEPRILLDGWGYEDTHETLNSFIWGPDGWLYGCHGVFTKSNVGKPGTQDKEQVPINAGYWRYHPTRKVFERFAEGTSNPWGLDYNQYGDFFSSCCVIPHVFHIVQGGRYTRQAGSHFNPHTYIEIPTIADHRHYVGNQWNNTDRTKSNDFGGGHAHCGLMCYQGGAWPKEYHGQLFMGNIHGARINMDILTPKGSTYVASHGKDFLKMNDPWSRIIALKYGPDGNMYFIDWYDKQACHHHDKKIWDRTNGRIYKVSYRGTKPVTNLDLAKCSDEELVKHQVNENEWYVQHARRLFQERYSHNVSTKRDTRTAKEESNDAKRSVLVNEMLKQYKRDKSPVNRLRAMLCLYCIHEYNGEYFSTQNSSDVLNAWHWKLTYDDNSACTTLPSEGVLDSMRSSIAEENSPRVRRAIAESLTHLEPQIAKGHYFAILNGLANMKPADDQMLETLLWYAIERDSHEMNESAIHAVKQYGSARFAEMLAQRWASHKHRGAQSMLLHAIETEHKPKLQTAWIIGLSRGIRSQSHSEFLEDWLALVSKLMSSPSEDVRRAARGLGVAMRHPEACQQRLLELQSNKATAEEKNTALAQLVDIKDGKLLGLLPTLLHDSEIRISVIRAMASYGNSDFPKYISDYYAKMNRLEKNEAINALTGRKEWAKHLMSVLERNEIPKNDVPAETIRQLRAFKDKELDAKIAAVWGTFRDTPEERKKLIAQWRRTIVNGYTPDLAHGRAVFNRTCAQCHTLFGSGGTIGPDITGSNRADVNYLLENIFDPNAVIPKDYAMTTFDLYDGRKLAGIVKQDGPHISLQTATDLVKFAAADVDKRTASEQSMMPEDLTKPLTETEVKNLIAYLRNPEQVPLTATVENAKDFFNGKDLTGWDGDKEVWSVVDGAIVGKSEKGLKKNTFLTSALEVSDFKLSLKAKLVPNKENSGIQFRSVRIDGGEMKGPQADMGAGWWGKLYEESARGLLVKNDNEKLVKVDDWNDYVIEAKGSTVKMWLNGTEVANLTDDKLAKKGLIGLQVHSGGPTEVRFKDLKLEVLK